MLRRGDLSWEVIEVDVGVDDGNDDGMFHGSIWLGCLEILLLPMMLREAICHLFHFSLTFPILRTAAHNIYASFCSKIYQPLLPSFLAST